MRLLFIRFVRTVNFQPCLRCQGCQLWEGGLASKSEKTSPVCLVCCQWPFSRAPFRTAAVCDIMVCCKSLQTSAGWFAGKFFSPAWCQHCIFNYFVALKTSKCLEIQNIDLVDEKTYDEWNVFPSCFTSVIFSKIFQQNFKWIWVTG